MALSRGMTALRAALGAVGGGLEGYAQFQAMEQKRKMEEEAARRAELGMLISSKQVRLRPVSRAGGGEPVGAVESPPPVATDSTLSRALQIGAETAPSLAATAPAPRTTPQKTALQVRREALQDLQSAFDAYAVPGEANPWDPTEQVTPEKVTSAKAEIDKYIRALEVQATTDPSLRQAAANLEQERKAGYDFYRQMRSHQFGQELSEEPMRPLIASANIIDALRQEGEQRRAMAVPGAQAAPTGPITDRGVATPQPPARPAGRPPVTSVGRVTLGGQEFDLLPALTPEEENELEIKKYLAQQGVIDARQQAALDRANRGYFAVLKRANYFGEGSKDLNYEDVKDINLEPFFKEYTQTRQAEAALERAGIIARASAGRGGYIQGVDPATGQPQYYFAPSGGGVPQPTGVQAPGKESPLSERAKKVQETTRPLSADDAAFVRSFMPTPRMDAKGNVIGYDPPQRRLPAGQALVSRGADIVGGLTGEAMYMGASPEAQRLSNIINQQADRRALAEQGGRLSDRDVAIKRAEVAIRSGDVKNDPVLYRKLNDVLSWAQTEPAPQAAQPSAQPTPQPTTRAQSVSKAQFALQWKAANPKSDSEPIEAYARRLQAAWMASQGGR